jgi:penicillin-binding protein 1A
VEVWTRFMRTAHEGVPVAGLPNLQNSWGPANLVQVSSQVSPPTQLAPPGYSAGYAPAPAPVSNGGYRAPPPPTRTNVNARPEAAAGLDGWLMDRLFGGNR